MTKDEWTAVSYRTFGEWWDAPQDEARIDAWWPELARFAVDDVLSALRRLLSDSPRFAPRLGELLRALEPPVPPFAWAWARIEEAMRTLGSGEGAVLGVLRRDAGDLVAGWVAQYGVRRLATEAVYDPDHGGAVLHRLEKAYREALDSGVGRRVLLAAAQAVPVIDAKPVGGLELGA